MQLEQTYISQANRSAAMEARPKKLSRPVVMAVALTTYQQTF